MPRKCPARRGAIVVLTAVLMALMLIFIAFAVDLGYLMVVRTELQNAADAAALAGAAALRDGASNAAATAEVYGEANATGRSAVEVIPVQDVAVGFWDDDRRQFRVLAGSDEKDANAVRVTCRRNSTRGNAVDFSFARILGHDTVDVSADAIARIKPGRCGLIVGLNRVTMSGLSYTDSFNSLDGAYSAGSARENGDVCSNGPIAVGSTAQINGDAHPGVGSTVLGVGTVTGDVAPLTKPLDFPSPDFGDAAKYNDNDSIPSTALGRTAVNSFDQFLMYGGDSVTLQPGVYYFTRMTLASGASVTITGPTVFYVAGDAYLSGGSVANATQRPVDLQLYSTGSRCTLSGSSQFHGVVYAPSAQVSRSGDADYYGMIVGREVILSGAGGIHADESLGALHATPCCTSLVQ